MIRHPTLRNGSHTKDMMGAKVTAAMEVEVEVDSQDQPLNLPGLIVSH